MDSDDRRKRNCSAKLYLSDQIRAWFAVDIRQIRYFVKVLDTGSLSKAAEKLRLSQPALGLQLRRLEEELNTKLIVRHSRGVVPTEEGRALYDHFVSILREIESTPQLLANLSGPPQGSVSLGVTASMGLALVPALVRACPIELPRVKVRVIEIVSEKIPQGIDDGQFDLGLSGVRHDNAYLYFEPLITENLFFIGPRGHEAASDKPIRLAEVMRYPLVLPTRNHPIRRHLDEVLRNQRLKPIIILELDSVLLKKELILQSGQLTILPFSAVYREQLGGSMFARLILRPRLPDTMYLVSSKRRPHNLATRAVQDLIRKFVRELIESGTWRWRLPS